MLDRIGITATSLCALHCILLPILLPMLSLLGLSFLADHTWEHIFLLMTALLGTVALYPFALLYLGLGLYWLKHNFSSQLELFFIIIGASFIISAHFINIKLCNSFKECDGQGCKSQAH
jgi:hypothetical protein